MLKNGRGKLSYEGPQDSPGCEVFQPRFHRGQKVGQSVQGLREEWQGSQYSGHFWQLQRLSTLYSECF